MHLFRKEVLHFPPNKAFRIIFPILRSTPALEVGMPVSLANFCLACVIPSALFHEKERPGMPVLDLRLTIITNVLRNYYNWYSLFEAISEISSGEKVISTVCPE